MSWDLQETQEIFLIKNNKSSHQCRLETAGKLRAQSAGWKLTSSEVVWEYLAQKLSAPTLTALGWSDSFRRTASIRWTVWHRVNISATTKEPPQPQRRYVEMSSNFPSQLMKVQQSLTGPVFHQIFTWSWLGI